MVPGTQQTEPLHGIRGERGCGSGPRPPRLPPPLLDGPERVSLTVPTLARPDFPGPSPPSRVALN